MLNRTIVTSSHSIEGFPEATASFPLPACLLRSWKLEMALADASSPAVVALRACASLAACYLFASLLPELRRVQRLRDSSALPALPILAMLANCVSWGLYGLLLGDFFPLVATNAVGLMLSSGYLVVYYRNTRVKTAIRLQMAVLAVLMLGMVALVATSTDATRPGIQVWVGYISIVVAALMVGSPLVKARQVIRTKSTDALPLGMIVSGAVNSALWLAYGIVLEDLVVILPNVLNLVLGVFQLALLGVYRKRKAKGYDTLHKRAMAVDRSRSDSDDSTISTPQVQPVSGGSSKAKEDGIELVVATTTTGNLSPRSRKAADLSVL